MKHLIWPLGWALLSACTVAVTPNPTPTPTPTPTPLPSSKVSAADLTGDWVWGEGTPPPSAGPLVDCAQSRPFPLKQEGQVLSGHVDICAGPCMMGPALTGTNQDGKVNLKSADGSEELILSYDARLQQLVGTRGGKPFYAVPFIRSTHPDCANRVY
jgi:hypothetical protein